MTATAPAARPQPRAILTLIRPDGSEGGTHELRQGENKIGREHGAIFENDGYLFEYNYVLGSPWRFTYEGPALAPYKARFDIKTNESHAESLIWGPIEQLVRLVNETPVAAFEDVERRIAGRHPQHLPGLQRQHVRRWPQRSGVMRRRRTPGVPRAGVRHRQLIRGGGCPRRTVCADHNVRRAAPSPPR